MALRLGVDIGDLRETLVGRLNGIAASRYLASHGSQPASADIFKS
jgi:hypothetical protein